MKQNNCKHGTENSKLKTNVKKKKNDKKGGNKKIAIAVVIIIVIILGIIAGFIYNKVSKVNFVKIDEGNLAIENKTGYRNIALLGVDTRDMNSLDGSRSDAIIIVSINEQTKNVNLISVYRDSYVDVQGHGLTKVTHAYAYGGPELALNTLNRNLDLDISEFVTVNFEIVADVVDLVGGIDIDIDKSELSQMNKYIEDTSKNVGRKANKITSVGKQHLDGIQAVTYARIRKTAGGDYKRTERMRTVLTEVFEKAKKMDAGKLNELANKVLPQVQTNIGLSEVISLIPTISSINISDSIGWPYEVKGITLDRWYGVPTTLEANVVKLHRELFGQKDYTASDIVKTISQSIINKTGYKTTSLDITNDNSNTNNTTSNTTNTITKNTTKTNASKK